MRSMCTWITRICTILTVHDAVDDGRGVLLHPPEEDVVREDGVEAECGEAEEAEREEDVGGAEVHPGHGVDEEEADAEAELGRLLRQPREEPGALGL